MKHSILAPANRSVHDDEPYLTGHPRKTTKLKGNCFIWIVKLSRA
jgi:hypothetical protein